MKKPSVLSFPPMVVLVLSLPLAGCQPPSDREAPVGDSTAARALADGTDREGASGALESNEFTADWFTHNIEVWDQILDPYRGKPDLRYLEIGVFEGRSLFWLLENILTHPSTRATGIDIRLSETLLANLEASGQAHRVDLIQGASQRELRALPPESFDIIYIDGSHTADDVLADAVMSWELLKTGGVLIFDDYAWTGDFVTGDAPLPDELLPQLAIEGFVRAYRHRIRELHRDYQLIIEKNDHPCIGMKGRCSPLGGYLYDWRAHRLFLADGTTPVEISDEERALIETILRSGSVDARTRRNDVYRRLRDRLDLPR